MTMRLMSRRRGISAVSLAAFAVLTSTSGATAVSNSEADSVVPGGQVTMELLAINGSGCPAGTARVTPQSDNTGFSVSYSDYVASANGGAEPTDFRKNCQLSIQVNVPQGFTYAVSRTDFSGYARLSSSASALQRANYYFQGSSEDNVSDHTIGGSTYGRWHTSDVKADASLVYSACGTKQVLNVNTELRVDDGTSTSSNWISMAQTGVDVATLFQFSWKRC